MELLLQLCSKDLPRKCLLPPLAKRGIAAKKHLFLRIGDKMLELTRRLNTVAYKYRRVDRELMVSWSKQAKFVAKVEAPTVFAD